MEDKQIYKLYVAINYQYLDCYTWGALSTSPGE